MGSKTHSIEVDRAIADALRDRAAERGVSVAELVAELVPLATGDEAIAELERRWAEITRDQQTVPHAKVERWLQSWGTPNFRPWTEQ